MNLTIIGAGGRTGRLLLEQAQRRGHQVTAVVRNADTLERDVLPSVTVRGADARDAEALTAALAGADAVVFAVGPSEASGPDIQSGAIRSTIKAMEATGIRRLLAISASGHSTDGDGPFTRAVVKPILQRAMRTTFQDMRALEAELAASDRRWTIIRPPMLTSKSGKGTYRSEVGRNVRGGYSISRADLARSIPDLLGDTASISRVVSVAN